jgi:hypothetical protein
MTNRNLAVSVAFLSMFTTNVLADECRKNFQEVTVTGTVNTQNITADMQVGTIDMQLTSKEGKVLFDELGAVVGQITDQGFDPEIGLPFAYLDHDITFADKSEIETNGDFATIYGDPTSGMPVPAVEVINNFQGAKTFKKATG